MYMRGCGGGSIVATSFLATGDGQRVLSIIDQLITLKVRLAIASGYQGFPANAELL
jgi:hypothetical protein